MKSAHRTADDQVVETCHSCGAAMPAEAQWCGQCYAVRGAAAPVLAATVTPGSAPPRAHNLFGAPVATLGRPAPAVTAPAAPPVKTRWRKTDTTFGPVGRIIATLALVVPFLVFMVVGIFTGGFEIGGAVIWGVVIMPWGLRDTWKAGQLPAR